MKKWMVLVLAVCILLGGCASKKDVSVKEAAINISKAETIAYQSVGSNDEKNLFTCESIKMIDDQIYYFIRGFHDNDDKMTTFGWYLVDINTGKIFDAGPSQNDLLPIS